MEIIVGIDFGTTNTVIYYLNNNNKVTILKDNNIYDKIPSKIGKYKNKYYCGNYIPIKCKNIINNFKLENNNEKLLLIFFNHIYDIIIKNLNCNKIRAIITVPSNFNNLQREKFKSCFEKVNINIIRIINEPSAAALAYGLNKSVNLEEIILVIDIGGGTTDFTILEKIDTFFEVKHSEGNNIGGNNFTELIYNDLINKKFKGNNLWNIAQNIKEKMLFIDQIEFTINNKKYNLSNDELYNLCENLLLSYKESIQNIINKYNYINNIILVGGTCKLKFIKNIISNFNIPFYIHPNIDLVVAEGACIYGSIIEKKHENFNEIILLDVVPLSLGVELVDGSFSVIIPKDTPLPVKKHQKYTTNIIGNNKITIKIYQGEHKIANKNFLIDEITFDKLTLSTNPIIDISFSVDLNSIINIYIYDKKSDNYEHYIITNNIIKISQNEINNIIENTIKILDIEEEETQKNQLLFTIKNNIQNIIININNNNLIDNKNKIINELITIENDLLKKNNIELLSINNYLNDNYSLLNLNNDINDDVDLLIYNDKKNELENILNNLLKIYSDDTELNDILNYINNDNISLDYIYDKINYINHKYNNINNKNILINLCDFIKNEITNNTIELHENKINKLLKLINYYENNIINNNFNDIDWKIYINQFNDECKIIYELE